jgi:Uracil-DNA glycosylase
VTAIELVRVPARARHCDECPYRAGPTIGTRGDPSSRIVLVGEAPGEREILEGQPFKGPAGETLRIAIRESGLDEGDLFITNAIACRPYPTARPHVKAIEACRNRLFGELRVSRRDVVVTLGATAFRATTGQRGFRMKDVRGHIVDSQWGQLMPTLHPARILRVRSERELLVSDLVRARELARRYEVDH